MIKVTEAPQRSDYTIHHTVNGDILIVTIDDTTEEFDFSGLPEGMAEEIVPDSLPLNPIMSAEKVGDEIKITLLRLYGEDEKGEFENVEN